jgi:CMP-N,N'-diacetyllegionaminic acid synthase
MNKKSICIIPARSGSKGIPKKNIKILNNKPLIQYSFETAVKSKLFDKIVLSTDSNEIAEVGKKIGLEAPFLRPTEIATDETPMIDVIKHTINFFSESYNPDIICILQPTSPFRDIKDLIRGHKLISNEECDSVVSVEKIPSQYSPYSAMKIINDKLELLIKGDKPVVRRQDLEDVYLKSGCFYFMKIKTLLQKKSLYGDICLPIIINNQNAIDLDTLDDWEKAKQISENFL